jgi:hypothetical protein
MKGKTEIPLKGYNRDYTNAKINLTIREGVSFNGIRFDSITRVGDHFEVDYTVTVKETEMLLLAPRKITCSAESF